MKYDLQHTMDDTLEIEYLREHKLALNEWIVSIIDDANLRGLTNGVEEAIELYDRNDLMVKAMLNGNGKHFVMVAVRHYCLNSFDDFYSWCESTRTFIED